MIVVVGLGPTGAVLAALLAQYGCPVVVVERDVDVRPLPRAVFFDDEVMRVLQQLGCTSALWPALRPVAGMDLRNADGALLYQYRPASPVGALTWGDGFMFQQPALEQTLRAHLAQQPLVTVRTGVDVERIDTALEGARVWYRDAQGARHQLHASYVIGCDGARSTVRQQMTNTQLEQLGEDATWLVVDLHSVSAPSLPEVTVQYCDPARPATFVPLPNGWVRFELRCLPSDDLESLTHPETLAKLLAPWIAPSCYTVGRAAVYTFHALLADRWHDGPLLLAGDAAHQMPPFLGQGMGSGVRDAANLAWKLALVVQGRAHASLLHSYQDERSPMTRRVIETDLWLGALIQTTDPKAAAARDAAVQQQGTGAVALTPPRFAIGSALGADAPPAGLPFPQWWLSEPMSQRSDALLGPHFTLVGPTVPSASARRILNTVGVTYLTTPPAPLREFLNAHGAESVLLRPDRLVHALMSDAASLDAALAPLARHLRHDVAVS